VLPAHQYAFTRNSSSKWPYIEIFDLAAAVPIDSLEPPHSHLRRFIPWDERTALHQGEYLIRIELFSETDSVPDYLVNVFTHESGETQLLGTSGLHPVENPSSDSLLLADFILKSAVRYSYK